MNKMWNVEDGMGSRLQLAAGGLGIDENSILQSTSKMSPIADMPVGSNNNRLYLLRHTPTPMGSDIAVDELDPITLETIITSGDLAAGPVWPGSISTLSNGNILVVFGDHIYLLSDSLKVLNFKILPKHVPYNGFVTIGQRYVALKNFGGELPNPLPDVNTNINCQILIYDTETLACVAECELNEPSVARLTALNNEIFAIGINRFHKLRFDPDKKVLTEVFELEYRIFDGQGYGWDCVIDNDFAWFLDNGNNTHQYNGSLSGIGIAKCPLHLVRIDLATLEIRYSVVCEMLNGIIANPPIVDVQRNIVVGYDTGNSFMRAFDRLTLKPIWERSQSHGSHMILYPETGELVTCDNTDIVILDINSGKEILRGDSQGVLQSVLFMTPGRNRDFYITTFAAICRMEVL